MAVTTRFKYSGTDIGANWLSPGNTVTAFGQFNKSGTDIVTLGRACADDSTCGGGKTCDSTSNRYQLSTNLDPATLVMTSCTSGGVGGVGVIAVGVILP